MLQRVRSLKINAADKTLTIKWSSGFDSYENTLAIGSGVNFNDYVSVKVERIAKEFTLQGKTYSFEYFEGDEVMIELVGVKYAGE